MAKLAGYGIITFSFLLKAPQIAKIVGSQSVLGLSAIAMYSETVGLMLNAVYNFLIGSPLSSYGEMVCILAQNIVLVALLWYYMSSEASLTRRPLVACAATPLTWPVTCLLRCRLDRACCRGLVLWGGS